MIYLTLRRKSINFIYMKRNDVRKYLLDLLSINHVLLIYKIRFSGINKSVNKE